MGSSLTAGYLVSILVILDESIWPLEALIPIFAKWNNKVTHSSVFLKMKKKKTEKKIIIFLLTLSQLKVKICHKKNQIFIFFP